MMPSVQRRGTILTPSVILPQQSVPPGLHRRPSSNLERFNGFPDAANARRTEPVGVFYTLTAWVVVSGTGLPADTEHGGRISASRLREPNAQLSLGI